MRKPRVLIVDDDVGILKYIRANLQSTECETLLATDGAEALTVVEKELPDLVILDIMMPKLNGFEVCRRIRQWSDMPIIMLSARQDVGEKVKCLNSGADDYVTKPFGISELRARVNAVLRRTQENGNGGSATMAAAAPTFTCGDLRINFVTRQVTIAGHHIKLTPTEYNLLSELALGKGKVLTHTYLLNKIWGPEYRGEREYLRVFIGRLRRLLNNDDRKDNGKEHEYIVTIPGVGYQLPTTAQ